MSRSVHLGLSAMERLEHVQLPYLMEGGIRSVGKRRTRRGSLDSSHSAERAATRRRAEYAKLAGDTSSPPRVASDQGSTGSLSSDASSRVKASDDDVDAAAFALQEYCASSPDAARVFVRKASPATVVRCLDWDAINAPKPKMREKYNNFDLLTFLEICRDEISAGGITGNGPNQFGYRNISMKLKEKKCFDRNFGIDDQLVSFITRKSIHLLKENHRGDLTLEEWEIVRTLKHIFRIS